MKLQAEGLPTRPVKSPARYPRHIGVVTSPTGAAIHDIHQLAALPVSGHRTLYPAVQGQAATADIVNAIDRAQRHGVADVLIIGRGGGSLEDSGALTKKPSPGDCRMLIPPSCVGHEVDVTIADFVADLRAPTPSAAAEKISPDQSQWLRRLAEQQLRLGQSARRLLLRLDQQLGHLAARLRDPRRELQDKAQRMDELDMRLNKAMNLKLSNSSLKPGTWRSAWHPVANKNPAECRGTGAAAE